MVPHPRNMVRLSMSSDNIIQFPGEGGKATENGGGSGPEDPMIEKRVEALEARSERMEQSLQRLELSFARVEARLGSLATKEDVAALSGKFGSDIAEIKGKISNSPTTWTLLGIVFSTWAIGSGIVFAIARMAK